MQLTRETPDANIVRAWEAGAVRIGEEWLSGHLILSAERVVREWPVADPTALEIADLRPALELEPEIILLGTGQTLVFPSLDLAEMLSGQRVGLEVMSTPAACRTFNVLVSERRRVVAALFNPAPSSSSGG
jgi:uncharacterized protein